MKVNRSVVRNQAYCKSAISVRERHNERRNQSYGNGDIITERSCYNIHFKSMCKLSCGKARTYEQEFNRMVDTGMISLRGLKPDAKVFDEFIFDVNSSYFEHNGGYEYAKEFFAEAYKLAKEEAGGEEYILSAVLHADERNKALSEQYGYDVFHYHLHVVYIPVVDKEIYFKKNNKNPELAGKLKEVIKQVSHSKKWPRFKDNTGRWINSYSLLQDRFYEHMTKAGYIGFERGERGSTTEHLSVLEYKTQQESERMAAMTAEVEKQQQAITLLNEQAGRKEKYIERLDEHIIVRKKAVATVEQIDNIGKPTLLGGFSVSNEDMDLLRNLAKRSITDRKAAADMMKERDKVVAELAEVKKKLPSIKDNLNWGKFLMAMKRAPKRLMQVIEDILRKPPERSGLVSELDTPKRTGFNIPR